MKREQIIEFAKKHIYIEYKKAGFGTYQELGGLEEFANAILALDKQNGVRKCRGCGTPLNDYCPHCQHLIES